MQADHLCMHSALAIRSTGNLDFGRSDVESFRRSGTTHVILASPPDRLRAPQRHSYDSGLLDKWRMPAMENNFRYPDSSHSFQLKS
jgi:hypothetical protein